MLPFSRGGKRTLRPATVSGEEGKKGKLNIISLVLIESVKRDLKGKVA